MLCGTLTGENRPNALKQRIDPGIGLPENDKFSFSYRKFRDHGNDFFFKKIEKIAIVDCFFTNFSALFHKLY